MAKSQASGTCLDTEFYVDEFWQFVVPSLDKNFKSYREMEEGIERASKALAATKREKLSLAAIDDQGKKLVITGIHAGHGNLVTNPKRDRNDTCYPDTPLTREALKELNRIEAEYDHVRALLKTLEVRGKEGYHQFNASEHPSIIAKVKAKHKAVTEMGHLPVKEALSKVPKPKKLKF